MASDVARIVVVCGFGVLSSLTVRAADPVIDPMWLTRAKTDLRAAHDCYREASLHLEEEAELVYKKPPSVAGGFTTKTVVAKTVNDGDRIRFERIMIVDGDSSKAAMTADCRNEDYRFSLRKADPKAAYVMVSYAPARPDDPRPGGGFHNHAYDLMQFILDAIEGRQGHTLNALGWDADKKLVKARIRVKRGPADNPALDHEVWMDPANQWRIVERRTVSPPTITHVVMTYGHVIDDLSYPSRIESTTTQQAGDSSPHAHKTDITVRVGRSALPESAFRLSDFGLPEPVNVAPRHGRGLPNYVWLLIGAGVCAALAAGFRYLGRRKSVPTP